MANPSPFVRPQPVEDPDLVADLQRDLGEDTLFFICAIEAALSVQIDDARDDDARDAVRLEENEQLISELLEEAA